MFRYDITFCANQKCTKNDCRRHHTNTPSGVPYSFAFFNEENRKRCDNYLKGGKKKPNE